MTEEKERLKKPSLTRKIYDAVIVMQVTLDRVVTQTDENTKNIQALTEDRHSYITKSECEKCKANLASKEKEEENKRESQIGRRMNDRISWRALKAVIIFNSITIALTVLFFILNYFK